MAIPVPGYLPRMAEIGYTLMGEQSGPRELVRDVVLAEEAGFDFVVASDHYFPWLREQGHSPNAWPVLGAVAQATRRIPFMTYVTCPIMRYHPAVIAQQAATVAIMSEGRFTLGLGAGENLNEHVVGRGWPPVNVRHEMFAEALEIITKLLASPEEVSFRGRHFSLDSAKLWDRPEAGVPIGVAVSGRQSCELAGRYADVMIAVEPDGRLGEMFDDAGGTGKPRVGQIPVSYDRDPHVAAERAHEQFRWFAGGWKVNAELPGPDAFAAATATVREEDVADSIPCGPDVGRHVEAVAEFVKAGFTHVALCQIGSDTQPDFIAWAEAALLPVLRDLSL